MKNNRTRALALICVLTVGCGETVSITRGTHERVLEQERVGRRPVGTEDQIFYQTSGDRLHLRIVQKHLCQEEVVTRFQIVERIEKKAKSENWGVVLGVSAVLAVIGGVVLAGASSQPDTGLSSDEAGKNPRRDAYGLGGSLLGIGASLALLAIPITGTSDREIGRDSRRETETVFCGERPFHGNVEITSASQHVEASTNTDGLASICLGGLGSVAAGEKLVLTAPAIGLSRELFVGLSTQRMGTAR
jgi:hypothetical protein